MIGDLRFQPDVPDELREVLAAEGLSLLGVAPAAVPPASEAGERRELRSAEYREWLSCGYHGEMTYLERHAPGKFDPGRMLPGCRAVIVVGLNYYQRFEAQHVAQRRAAVGRVARYAWGRDYHKTLGGKLRRARRRLQERYPSHGFRSFTDAVPLAERLFSEEAGIAFIGRNTLAISAPLGSWFVIGEILTTVPWSESRTPSGVHGACPQSCRRCIEVCPTGALRGPHRIDAASCISYLTIELKGSIPLKLRPMIGNWLFGCDLCQEVCPLNAPAEPSPEPDFTAWRAGPVQELERILMIETDEEFAGQFRGTPLMRAKRRGLLRNACVVAANVHARSLVPLLQRRAEDGDPIIVEHAIWAIGQLAVET